VAPLDRTPANAYPEALATVADPELTPEQRAAHLDRMRAIARSVKVFDVADEPQFIKNESGATAIEYGLIAAGIAIAIITAVNGVGSALSTTFGTLSTSLK
jgi:pilus assembly protein Flp/PilA